MLRLGRLLDVRSDPDALIRDAVNIPWDQLAARVYELPAKGETVLVADTGEEARRACEWLIASGRHAVLEAEWDIGPSERLRLWRPNAFLEEVVNGITPGIAIDLACGTGRDAVFLASAGFHVTAIDVLEDALELGKKLEQRGLPGAPPIDWKVMDLEKELPACEFQLAISFFYLDRQMIQALASQIRPGGHVVLETFTTEHRRHFGKPRREKLVLELGELPTLLPGFRIHRFEEGLHGERYTARLWAQKA